MYVLVCIYIYLVSESAPTQRLPPTSPSLAGWPGGCRERGTCEAVSIIPLGSCSGGGLAGRTAAAAGSGWTCWRSQECSAPSLSRVICCRLCLTFTGKKDEKKTGMERSSPTPSTLCLASLPGGSGTVGAPTATAESHCCWTAAGTYIRAGLYLFTFGLRTCTARLPPTLQSLAGWRGGCRKRGTCLAVSIIPLGSCSGGGLAGRTAAAAGFGWTCWRSQECSAPSRNLCNSKPILSSRHLLKLCNKFFFPTSFFLNKFFQSIKALGLQYNWRCMPFC